MAASRPCSSSFKLQPSTRPFYRCQRAAKNFCDFSLRAALDFNQMAHLLRVENWRSSSRTYWLDPAPLQVRLDCGLGCSEASSHLFAFNHLAVPWQELIVMGGAYRCSSH